VRNALPSSATNSSTAYASVAAIPFRRVEGPARRHPDVIAGRAVKGTVATVPDVCPVSAYHVVKGRSRPARGVCDDARGVQLASANLLGIEHRVRPSNPMAMRGRFVVRVFVGCPGVVLRVPPNHGCRSFALSDMSPK